MSTQAETGPLRYLDAVREGIADAMRADETVCLLGIDVGAGGGIFRVTAGLFEEFGPDRVLDTPISEMAFLGAAVGAAATGLIPVVELMFMDFLGVCLDPLLNQVSKLQYMTAGALRFPLVVRTQMGAGRSSGAQHSQSLEAVLAHIPGLKVVMPRSVQDAYSLMRSAIADPGPVIFVENRMLYGRRGEFDRSLAVPLGSAAEARAGGDATIIAWSRMVDVALSAAEALASEDGIEAEVIDLRSLVPLDFEAILASVAKTHCAVIVHEAVTPFGPGAEIAARLADEGFDELDAPVVRVGVPGVPMPFSPPLEAAVLPNSAAVRAAVLRALAR